MNIEPIKAARAEVAELLASFDKIIAFHAGTQAALAEVIYPLALPPSSSEPSTRKPARRQPKQEPKPVRHPARGGGGRNRSPQFEAIVQWCSARIGPFKTEDLPPALRRDAKKTCQLLSNLAIRGKLQRVGYGVYQSLAAASPTHSPAPGPQPALPGPAPLNGKPELVGKRLTERVGQAARYIIGLHGGQALSARSLIDECRSLWPELVETPNREQDFRVALIDAANGSLLVRRGVGPDAVYGYNHG